MIDEGSLGVEYHFYLTDDYQYRRGGMRFVVVTALLSLLIMSLECSDNDINIVTTRNLAPAETPKFFTVDY
ncbi:hypothetical protein KIN20_009124 [Parelaphostrongylus tenuis]|uniref:Uncharacterized protein n=1 Tax=Parelaphostrongylus tenuis TaxID=148309 RepID=A0AAD5QKE1_PARTN|nr:hypothetical protein KIN20_009124 [Parelaphostrongylus tenuis]